MENYPLRRPSASRGSSRVPSLPFAHCLLPCLMPQNETLKTLNFFFSSHGSKRRRKHTNGNIWLNGQGLTLHPNYLVGPKKGVLQHR
ncbi:hypothetical protein GmHk_01G002501 [Glycine max]|nr:hypothetical protein GmHk_01G002501 [Glycine max]